MRWRSRLGMTCRMVFGARAAPSWMPAPEVVASLDGDGEGNRLVVVERLRQHLGSGVEPVPALRPFEGPDPVAEDRGGSLPASDRDDRQPDQKRTTIAQTITAHSRKPGNCCGRVVAATATMPVPITEAYQLGVMTCTVPAPRWAR
jgi:hypothetical protein